jgi:SAM-dependent methyltransferase
MFEFCSLLPGQIPDDHSRQCLAETLISEVMGDIGKSPRVLDLGPGEGKSIDDFRSCDPTVSWIGLDIEHSPEANLRSRKDAQFVVFDGVNIPLASNSMDIVFSKQVIKHVQHPHELIAEVSRILKTGRYFLGSLSYLEPFHSYSTQNFTPYGFSILLQEHGLKVQAFRPGIDVFSLAIANIFGYRPFFSWCWTRQSPLHILIDIIKLFGRYPHEKINSAKLKYSGQFCFIAQKQ